MTADQVVWQGWPQAPAPVAHIRQARRRNPAVAVVDDAGHVLTFGRWLVWRETLRVGWQRLLDVAIGCLARLLPAAAPLRSRQPGSGPVVLVLPVLPDLSHTFVYREVLALLRQRPDWRVFVLSRNSRAPVHAEAAALLKRVEFLPRDGVTRRACRLLRWLLRPAGRALFALYRAEPGGDLHDLLGKLPLRDPRHPGNAFVLADQLAALQPRSIHVYSSTWPANVAMGAAALLGVPCSISSYVDFEFEYSHRMLKAKLQQAHFFRVVTAYCRQQLLRMPEAAGLPAAHIPVIYLGLDLAEWQAVAQPSQRGLLVSAARLVPKKGLHLVPSALAVLRARGIVCRWRVLGDGPELPAIQAACTAHGVADLVDFLGPCDNQRVRSELLTADAALLPCVVAADGERDGIPIFLCEAMALGLPVVTTPVAGIPELVRDGETGYLATPGDSADLARALVALFADPARAAAIGARARAAVREQLDVDQRATELIRCIES